MYGRMGRRETIVLVKKSSCRICTMADVTEDAVVVLTRLNRERVAASLLCSSCLNMNMKRRTTRFKVAARMFDSSNELLFCRVIISVSRGCLKEPGEGEMTASDGFEVGVAGLWGILGGATTARPCPELETRVVEVADIVAAERGERSKRAPASSVSQSIASDEAESVELTGNERPTKLT
jgi:hypothetical protein